MLLKNGYQKQKECSHVFGAGIPSDFVAQPFVVLSLTLCKVVASPVAYRIHYIHKHQHSTKIPDLHKIYLLARLTPITVLNRQ